ncbi:hypothetical protein ABW19_dt0203068 [Dactylella cylindrospora]|nr:hypothetical protein ABW19_dt0203068 [Dactylella cylindrospora]
MTTPATPTPRRSLARLRPSGAGTPSMPPVPPPMLSPDTLLARKQSFNQLTQNSSSKDSGYGGDSDGGLEIGDKVNVPGGMYGVVKFVGTVKGKPGVFVGVELEGPHAVNGKNDGTVEGTRYFTTSVPHSGIFLPLSRATLRHSGSSVKSDTPSLTTTSAEGASSPLQPPKKPFARPSLPRPQSPAQRGTTPRPSLLPNTPGPRSGSSLSNRMISPSPTPGMSRNRGISFSSSNAGDATPGPSSRLGSRAKNLQTPSTKNLREGFNTITKARPPVPRDTPRASSSLSYTNDTTTPTEEATPRANGTNGFAAKLARMSKEEDKGMIAILQAQLSAKDHQLKEQANNLLEMETSLNELQTLLNDAVAQDERQQAQRKLGVPRGRSASVQSGDGEEELEIAQLRHLLREKNEKIAQLNLDFDSHRADFRSTIDTLEMAASETERVYEKKVEDLLAECRELERQRQELLEERVRRDEEGVPAGGMENVARQLKQLEGLVTELEEGLEDARRGEAEARAEAEHCRGETERAKEELRREKEKNLAFERRVEDLKESVKISEVEVEKKNDEIRGLKAIMTSLSRGKPSSTNSSSDSKALEEERAAKKKLEERIKDLEVLVDRKATREVELEKELEQLKTVAPAGLKITMPVKSVRIDPGSPEDQRPKNELTRPIRSTSLKGNSPALTDIDDDEQIGNGVPPPPPPKNKELYCELCEKTGHDILSCTDMFGPKTGGAGNKKDSVATFSTLEKAGMTPLPLNTSGVAGRSSLDRDDDVKDRNGGVSLSGVDDSGLPAVAGKSSGVIDRTKWCALCERDGHDSVDCPLDDI